MAAIADSDNADMEMHTRSYRGAVDPPRYSEVRGWQFAPDDVLVIE